ncbi:hypothetical protein B0H11DRAFT_2202003 [Mycena galericulata]|nr:hypothetical protein B0H11DRAFT_2202003 [Mycena galericulata]
MCPLSEVDPNGLKRPGSVSLLFTAVSEKLETNAKDYRIWHGSHTDQPHFVMDQAKSNFRVNNVFPGHTLRKPQLGIPRGGAHPWNNIWAANGLHGSDGNLGSTSQTGNP